MDDHTPRRRPRAGQTIWCPALFGPAAVTVLTCLWWQATLQANCENGPLSPTLPLIGLLGLAVPAAVVWRARRSGRSVLATVLATVAGGVLVVAEIAWGGLLLAGLNGCLSG